MNILAIGTLTGADHSARLADEAAVTERWRADGFLQSVYLKADRTGPVLLVVAEDAGAARRRFAELPFVEHGIATFEYIELIDPRDLPLPAG